MVAYEQRDLGDHKKGRRRNLFGRWALEEQKNASKSLFRSLFYDKPKINFRSKEINQGGRRAELKLYDTFTTLFTVSYRAPHNYCPISCCWLYKQIMQELWDSIALIILISQFLCNAYFPMTDQQTGRMGS